MRVTINDESVEIRDGATVADLLRERGLADAPCAVEVNRALRPKREHATTELKEGDAVEIVTLVGGG